MTANLRYGAGYETPRPSRYFDYSEYGGMAGAVEMCSGLGACRKTLDGTMCPSYMATRDEADSTRGRANVLRLAMAGRLGESGLGDEGVYQRPRSVPGVSRVQGRVPGRRGRRAIQERVSRRLLVPPRRCRAMRASWATPTASRAWAAGSRRCRTGLRTLRSSGALNERDPRHRSAARACRRSLPKPLERRRPGQIADPDAVLFTDTFTNYYDPEIGLAAIDVLERRRRATSASPATSAAAGRKISKGVLDDARGAGGRERRPTLSARRRRAPGDLLRAELPVGRSGGRARSSARRAAAPRADGRGSLRALRGGRSIRSSQRLTFTAARQPSCFTAIATRSRWDFWRRRRRCCHGCLEQRSSISNAGCCGMAGLVRLRP